MCICASTSMCSECSTQIVSPFHLRSNIVLRGPWVHSWHCALGQEASEGHTQVQRYASRNYVRASKKDELLNGFNGSSVGLNRAGYQIEPKWKTNVWHGYRKSRPKQPGYANSNRLHNALAYPMSYGCMPISTYHPHSNRVACYHIHVA